MNKGLALLFATAVAAPALAQPKTNGSPAPQAETVHLYLKANGTGTKDDPSQDPLAPTKPCAVAKVSAAPGAIWPGVVPKRAEQPSTQGVAAGVPKGKTAAAAAPGYVGLNPPDRSARTGVDACDGDDDNDRVASKASKCPGVSAAARQAGPLPPSVGVAETATDLKVKPLADRKGVKPSAGASSGVPGEATAAARQSVTGSTTDGRDEDCDG